MGRNDNTSINREINILDMLYYIVSKWKSIFIVAIIFMILAGVYSYMFSGKVIETQYAQKMTPVEVSEEEAEEIRIYDSYKNIHKNLQTYRKDSPWMNMSSDIYYEADIQYYVRLNENDMGDTEMASVHNAIMLAYKKELETVAFKEKLKEIIGDDIKEEYYNEIIDLDGILKKKIYNNSLMLTSSSGLISATIRVDDERVAEEIVNLIGDTFDKVEANIDRQVYGHKLILINNQILCKSADEIYVYQKNIYNSIKDVIGKYEDIEKTFTEQQKLYYEQNYEDNDAENEEPKEVVVPTPIVNKKFVIVGFLLGFICLCVVYAFAYLSNTKIMVEDDFERIFGQKLICRVDLGLKVTNMFFVDKFLLKLRRAKILTFDSEDALPMIVTSIKIACKKKNVSKVVFSCNKVENQSYIEEVSSALKETGIEVILGNSVLYDYKTLEEAADDAMILLFEQAGVSEYLAIQQEIDICRYNGIDLIGAVVIS